MTTAIDTPEGVLNQMIKEREHMLADLGNSGPFETTRHRTRGELRTLERARDRIKALPSDDSREVVEDLVRQFAYEKDGMLYAGGLSALEAGFFYLGWDIPHTLPPPPATLPPK